MRYINSLLTFDIHKRIGSPIKLCTLCWCYWWATHLSPDGVEWGNTFISRHSTGWPSFQLTVAVYHLTCNLLHFLQVISYQGGSNRRTWLLSEYCKTCYFCCSIILQFWCYKFCCILILHFPSVRVGKLNFHGYLISQCENFVHAKIICFTVYCILN